MADWGRADDPKRDSSGRVKVEYSDAGGGGGWCITKGAGGGGPNGAGMPPGPGLGPGPIHEGGGNEVGKGGPGV
jgi:hypothetical protein